MRVELQRSGGFAGRTTTWSVDVDALDDDGRQELRSLVASAGQWAAPPEQGADRFTYRLVTEEPGVGPAASTEVSFAEPLAPDAQRLVSLLRSAAG
jgi:hypothetical protein